MWGRANIGGCWGRIRSGLGSGSGSGSLRHYSMAISDAKNDRRLMRWSAVPPGYSQTEPGPDDEIVVSMSSGVDSSVAALMYSQRYKNVRGVFMANWSSSADGSEGAACSQANDKTGATNSSCTVDHDWLQVQQTCRQLGIPCERISFEKEYWIDVFEPMLALYERGLTPNPDVGCNRYVKFGSMIRHLERALGPTERKWWMVTGHYGRVLRCNRAQENQMLRASYLAKDQSYYLSQVQESVLDHVLLPLGHYTKPEVREIAADYGLVTSEKPDSEGLCFVNPQLKFGQFLDEYLAPNPGEIVDGEGHVWGRHRGLWHGTIGQRSGVSLPQGDPRYQGAWFVCDKDIENNRLVIAPKRDRRAFERNTISTSEWQWMNGTLSLEAASGLPELNVQIRSLENPHRVTAVRAHGDGITVSLADIYKDVAPGQDLVLYSGDRLLGSGMISRAVYIE